MSRRLVRVNELLKREVAEVLYRIMNDSGFDMAAVTVTRVITSPDLRQARVMVSIRDHQDERGRMLRLIRKHARAIQRHIHKNIRLKYTPHLSFELDVSIEQGDRVLSIISEMEAAEAVAEENHEEPRKET